MKAHFKENFKGKILWPVIGGGILLFVILQFGGVPCPIKYVTGISCAGCGMTRAWISVMHFQIGKAFYYHPLFWLPPIVLVVILLKKYINPTIYRIILFTSMLLFVIIYLYRLIQGDNDVVVFEPQNNIMFRLIRNKG